MKNTTRSLLFALFAVTSLNVAASQPFSKQDTLSFINKFILQENINYIGYRMYISDITKIKEKRGKIYFSFTLTNTGKETIKLEKGINTLPMVFRTEKKLSKSELKAYKSSILNAILFDLNIKLDIAERKKDIEISVPVINIEPQKEDSQKEEVVSPEATKKQSSTDNTIKNDSTTEKNLSANEQTSVTTLEPKNNNNNQNKTTELEEVTHSAPTTTDSTDENTAIKTKLPKVVVTKTDDDSVPSSKVPEVNQEASTGSEKTKSKNNTKEEKEIRYKDLIFENIKILKRKKKWVLIEFSIKNIGNETVNMIGDPKIEEDNLAIRAYFSGTPRLSRGAIVTGGMFFDAERKNPDSAFLKPGQTITKTIKVDTKMRTRYLKVLIFAIDPFNAIDESNRKNNTTHVILK